MQINYTTKGKHLTEKERYLIEKGKKEGKATEKSLEYLERDIKPSTIKSNVVS